MPLPYNVQSTNGDQYAYGVSTGVLGWRLPDPDPALQQDAAAPEKMLAYPAIGGAQRHLVVNVVGSEWSMRPEGKARQARDLAGVVEQLMRKTRGLSQILGNLTMASFMGSAWGRIRTETKILTIGDGKPREWTVVAGVDDIDKRRFRRIRVEPNGRRVDSSLILPTGVLEPVVGPDGQPSMRPRMKRQGEPVFDGEAEGETDRATWHWEFHGGQDYHDNLSPDWHPVQESIPLNRLIQMVFDTREWGLGFGFGDSQSVYWPFYSATNILQNILRLSQRFGQGLLDVEVEILGNGARGQSPATILQNAVNAYAKQLQGTVIAHDSKTKVKAIDFPAAALDSQLGLLRYFDGEMRTRILGAADQVTPTAGGSGSSGYAKSKTGADEADSLTNFMRSPLQDCWTSRVVLPILLDENRENLLELGLWGADAPTFAIIGQENYDPEQQGRVLLSAKQLGLPVSKKEAYRRLGLTEPAPDDDALEPAALGSLLGQAGIPGAAPPPGGAGDPVGAEPRPDPEAPRAPVGDGEAKDEARKTLTLTEASA